MFLAGLVVAITIALGFFLANLGRLQVGSYMRVFSTQSTLARIEDGLARYAAVRQRLPCPANPALDASLAAAGYANADTTDATTPATCAYPTGVVPWKSLGLTVNDAIDPWGRLVSYRVYDGTIGLTQAGGASRLNCDTDNGTTVETAPVNGLCSSDTNTLKASYAVHPSYPGTAHTKGLTVTDYGTSTSAIAYALISHGPSGLGGYLPTGTRLDLPGATATDYPNTQAAATLVKTAFSAASVTAGTSGHFDDVVVYKSIDDLIILAKLDSRNWPEVETPKFTVATTSNMETASTDSANPHFMTTGTTAAQTSFTSQQVAFGGAPAETVIYGAPAAKAFSECLWWPLKLTMYDLVTPRDLRAYVEFASIDNTADPFSGLTMAFLAGNDGLGAPTNSTCGSTSFSTTATGAFGSFNITVADPTGIVAGLDAVGTGIGTGGTGAVATVFSVAGNTVTLSRANTAAVNGGVTFANSRLIRRDLGWASGTVSSYVNRFAVELDTNIDTGFGGPPVIATANDPSRPHLAIDEGGVIHGTDAETCATTTYGSGCDTPPGTFSGVATTATFTIGQSTIVVASISGIALGMSVTGTGIGFGATVVDITNSTITLGTGGSSSTPVVNTSTQTNTAVAFAALSSTNFLQNGLSEFHSLRVDILAKACVSKATTTGVLGASTITVPDNTQIAPGMVAYGRHVATGVTVTNVVGTTITLSSANTGAVNERIDFALAPAITKTATGVLGALTILASDNHRIGVGMTVSGTGIASGANVTNVVGTTVTLSAANTSAVSGTLTFTPPTQARTATGTSGQNQVAVSDATGIVTGMEVSGFGIGTGATVTAIAGTTLTLSTTNTVNIAGTVYVRPTQTLVKSWAFSAAGCNADAASCNALKDVVSPFGRDLSADNQAIHAVACLATPSPSTSFNDLYLGITTSNRATNVLTGFGANLALRRLTVNNPASP